MTTLSELTSSNPNSILPTTNGGTGVNAAISNIALVKGMQFTLTNPDVGGDANYRRAIDLSVRVDETNLDPGFTTATGLAIVYSVRSGDYSYGSGTNAKTTYYGQNVHVTGSGSGQRFCQSLVMDSYGMGDSFIEVKRLTFANGPKTGDEGQAFSAIGLLQQQPYLSLATITAIPQQSTVNTTITQEIIQSKTAQTVTVASSSGCTIGDWVVIEQAVDNGAPNIEAVQLTGVAAGSITGIFRNHHLTGVTVTPAKVLTLSSTWQMGQGRVLVNRDGASYSTGTVASSSGGALTGSGTTWTASMVGGTATNIGAIYLDDDTYVGEPFNGSEGASNGPLRSYYQIIARSSNTSIGIHSWSVASDASYRGKLSGGSTYKVLPAARILFCDFGVSYDVVLETTAHTWTVGDDVECAICPYPDVAGFQYHCALYTPGLSPRSFMLLRNAGARALDCGVFVGRYGAAPTGADAYPFNIGIELSACNAGVVVRNSVDAAIIIPTGVSDAGDAIRWGSTAPYIRPNTTNAGLDFELISSGAVGTLSSVSSLVLSESLSRLNWTGSLKITGYSEMQEIAEPAAPPSNCGRRFFMDVGGKTAYMVRFPSGVSQQIAIEP